jgi:hypothetical protein
VGVKRRAPVEGKGKGKEKEEREEEEEGEEEEEIKQRKRVRLETDEERAQLVKMCKMCIKHFAQYSEGRDRYFTYIRGVWEKEMKSQAPSVKDFMVRHEKIWRRELEEGDFPANAPLGEANYGIEKKRSARGGKPVVHSELTLLGFEWLQMLQDFEEQKKKKKRSQPSLKRRRIRLRHCG